MLKALPGCARNNINSGLSVDGNARNVKDITAIIWCIVSVISSADSAPSEDEDPLNRLNGHLSWTGGSQIFLLQAAHAEERVTSAKTLPET